MCASTARESLDELKVHLGTIADVETAAAVLDWDQHTYMPPGGAETRASQLGTLSQIAHEQFTSARTRTLLDAAEPLLDSLAPDSDDAALLRVTRRDLTKASKLPSEFVAEVQRAASLGTHAWQEARARNDFAAFRPHLELMFELMRREADYLGYREHPYDALMDNYEPEMTSREVKALFDRLLEVTVPLVRAIAARSGPGADALAREYDETPQRAFGLSMAEAFGYDTTRGRLDTSAHPFSTGFSRDDVRITTRFQRPGLGAIFAIFHEAGHAMYNQGVPASLQRTPLADGASYGIHESQSRLWENLVGRSRAFWEHAFPALRRAFPAQLEGVDVDAFYRSINRVEPSLIRIHADEITYNLHIILRFELEQAVLTGALRVADLPEAWNAKMASYLGMTPPTDTDGVLQDTHWAGGSIGYFPSYTLGSVAAVQLFEAARRAHPDLTDQIGRGEFQGLLGWLREHVHAHGRKFFPRDLLVRATGSALTPEPYLAYLKAKFGAMYGISAA
jgi:carboxypeptidase Taq